MKSSSDLPANDAAKSIVRHFQSEGFAGISEALIIRIGLKGGSRSDIETTFKNAANQEITLPVHQYFEIRPLGHFSETRSFADAKSIIQSDFTPTLRLGLPKVYFDPAPVVIDDVLADSTKYDALIKLRDNMDNYCVAVLLNDPDYAFLDYLGTHYGNDWQQIMGKFETTLALLEDELI